MKFSKLADIHERLRLGDDKLNQLARLNDKEEALACYEFFFPNSVGISWNDAVSKISTDIGMYFDVVKDILPKEDRWYALASESSASGSRGLSAQAVLDFPFKAASFTDIAHNFNEIEARLLWRWLTKSKPVMGKRSFFSALARLKSVPPHLVHQNMTTDTLIKLYDNPQSIHILSSWWAHKEMLPAPFRWKPWRKLHPPEKEMYALIVPKGNLCFQWNGNTCLRNGDMIHIPKEKTHNEYREILIDSEWENIVVDAVDYDSPHATFRERLPLIRSQPSSIEVYDLTEHGSWDKVNRRLQHQGVAYVRLIEPSQVFKPDSIGGYVLHPNRNKVFLRLHSINSKVWTLASLDGIDDYIPVCSVPVIDETMKELDDDSCIVVEIVAVRVNGKGQITQAIPLDVRPDLGISDITQLTDLIERGMEDDDS
tara:strand:+ start:1529 stop:2806 length:1278 start_codon:yes stop_codon:yes gene_type:complete